MNTLQDVALIFEPITSLVTKEQFNPWSLYHRYKNRGIPNRYLAEAIVDGFVDAYLHHSADYPIEQFGGYCTRHCKGKIHDLRRQLLGVYRKNRQTFVRKTQVIAFDPYYLQLLSSEDKYVSSNKLPRPVSELFGVDAKGILSQLIPRAIPLDKNGKVSKIAQALFLHYVLGDSWIKVAEKLGMKSRQLAQHYGKKGEEMLFAFCDSDEGQECLKRIAAEYGGEYVYDEDAEYNDPNYVKEVITGEVGISVDDVFALSVGEEEDEFYRIDD